MNIQSHNTLFALATHLQSTPSLGNQPTPTGKDQKDSGSTSKTSDTSSSVNDSLHLSGHDPELAKLQARDREVRAHEAAHSAAAGSLANGGPSYTFQKGSDGRLYAVGGEVNIDTSADSNDPQATIQKARQIRAAANAPANPSAQDRAVAAQATRMEAQARQELQQERTEDIQETTTSRSTIPTPAPQIIDLFA
ncbi:MAG: putative metalloprotease CJM1_0395 family protein [Nitrospirae bacterium]|nr:putative metalloprotease CJM1_0395 family protein [Nitrospirota bacterium]MDA1303151.1 putative metalloprotease CJM1_0395 family protein [Nitrospirota bacterium]